MIANDLTEEMPMRFVPSTRFLQFTSERVTSGPRANALLQ